jgi:hypothetical protein
VRIAYVAGFFQHVLPELQTRLRQHLESGAVVWIPPYGGTYEPNVNPFKGRFLDAVGRGATDVLVCLFAMRGNERVPRYVEAIVDEGKVRTSLLHVDVQYFESARDAAGVIERIEAFNPTIEDELPSNLPSLAEWAAKRHCDTIIILPRAVNAAKKSRFGDVGLIYAAISFLGTEYWRMRTSPAELATDRQERYDKRLRVC